MRNSTATKRLISASLALVFTTALAVSALYTATASAYGLVTARSIQLSSSAAGAGSVTYKVKYTAATTGTIQGIVVDFCSNSPIIGDSCTLPTGFNIPASPTVTQVSGITGFTAAASNNRTLILNKAGGQAMTAGTTTVEFDITSVTNPSTANETFYARILTYDTTTNANAYSPTASGGGTGTVDAGGIALSTASQITVTSKVQERLTFCVYTGANCAAGGSTVTLGDSNGVLDPSGPYVDKNTKFDIATNASQGVDIRIKGTTLTSGSFTISAIGATPAASSAGSEQFGFCAYEATGSGLVPDNLYDGDSAGTTSTDCAATIQTAGTGATGGAGSTAFAFDGTNTNTTYGQIFATKTAGSTSQGIIPFVANISNTTEAGIYTTTLTFVATGKY